MRTIIKFNTLAISVMTIGLFMASTVKAEADQPISVYQSSAYDATVDSNSLVTLTGSTIKSVFVASISGLNFSTAQEAETWFAMRNDNIVSFQVDWTKKEVTINLTNTGNQASWGIKEWNDYFKNKSNWY